MDEAADRRGERILRGYVRTEPVRIIAERILSGRQEINPGKTVRRSKADKFSVRQAPASEPQSPAVRQGNFC